MLDELAINLWGLCTWHILKMVLLSMESVTELCSQLVVTCVSPSHSIAHLYLSNQLSCYVELGYVRSLGPVLLTEPVTAHGAVSGK
jgi:hypothetical protein